MVLRPATGLRSTQASLLMAIATACTPTISRLAEYLVMDFFFSSRRRHTISTRDLSSDVCSSDLVAIVTLWGLLVFAGLAIAFGYPLDNGISHLADDLPSYVSQVQHGKGWLGH